ncbi:hypothetical protein [Clostridium fallax]|uniref:Uncharacterized protein n=1 Tax=Clostridium fallax TaxID=1533 RepID=A0A1M4TX42_9CLOT|nr:hypothetical protein [Clostridium fallax]SHE49039.1 hypothetical protein SAMN05443638_103177 [Clostridium fallax]SQB22348.1 Uncharacterised protein [Clostridium fallax]
MKKSNIIYVDFHSRKIIKTSPGKGKNINVLKALMINIKNHLPIKKSSDNSNKYKDHSSLHLM